jgi:uncharacterized protein YbaP (TraB family)
MPLHLPPRWKNPLISTIIACISFLIPACLVAQPGEWPAHRLVWEMTSPKGANLHLAPTIHIVARQNPLLPKAFERRLAKTKLVLIEADLTDKEDLLKALAVWAYPSVDDNALNHLSRPTADALARYLEERKLPIADIIKLKPWAIQNLMILIELKRAGLGTPPSAESLLVSAARSQSVPIQTLESLEAQSKLFDSFPSDIADQRLRSVLADVTSPAEFRRSMIELTNAWYAGSWSDLKSWTDKAYSPPPEIRPFVDKTLLFDRNKAFVDKLEALETTVRPEENVMLSVGFMHYIGDRGLVQLLQERGYRLKP